MKFVFLSTAFLPNICRKKIKVLLLVCSQMKLFACRQQLANNNTRINVLLVSEIVDSLTVPHYYSTDTTVIHLQMKHGVTAFCDCYCA
jgi:hypothetical protein